MKIAIPLINGALAPMLDDVQTFAFIEADTVRRAILNKEEREAPLPQPAMAPYWLAEQGAKLLFVGRIRETTRIALAERGIAVLSRIRLGKPEELVTEYLEGTLKAEKPTRPQEGSELSHQFDHDWCLLCGQKNPSSFRLVFEPDDNGGVVAQFHCQERLQGYTGMLHGGVLSALLDAAMTHCLFHQGIRAVTAELTVRFLHPVPHHSVLTIRGWLESSHPKLYRLKSELLHGDQVMARAEAKFLAEE